MKNEQRLIEYDAVYKYAFDGVHGGNLEDEDFSAIINAIDAVPTVDAVAIPDTGIGDLSDGYHTFNELYYQRLILFAALVRQHKDRAWKSFRHEDGELCFGGGWFIVGIDTPEGSYTYHYENKHFDLFDCVELPTAKHWDGHTEKDVTRLLSLSCNETQRWIPVTERMPELIPCNAGTAYSEAVNVLTSGRKVVTAIWDGTEFIADAAFWEADGETITHWAPVLLPLPGMPKAG